MVGNFYLINKKCTQPLQFLAFSVFVVAKEDVIAFVIKLETVLETVLEIVVVVFVELSLFVKALLELDVCVVLA